MSDAQDEYENKQPFKFPNETPAFIETKPKRIFNFYPNVVEKQRDTLLKSSNANQIYNTKFDFPKQKTKLTSKHFENSISKIRLNDNPTKNDPSNKKKFKNNR